MSEAANAGNSAASNNRPFSAPETRKPMQADNEGTSSGASWWSPDRLLAHDDLDDTHGLATAPTQESRRGRHGGFILDDLRSGHIEQGAHLGKILPSPGIGQQAVVTDAVETARQHM